MQRCSTRSAADQALEQVANVAFLPGIQYASLAMPDIHWGYGFCIGGVCATDPAAGGVISPGGVGYDINCGVRLVRSNLFLAEVKPHLNSLVDELFRQVPTGVGRGGKYQFSPNELRSLMATGPRGLIERGLAVERDVEYAKAHGRLDGADAGKRQRAGLAARLRPVRHARLGQPLPGSAGRRPHLRRAAARAMGLAKDMVCVMIHSGSRGLGYQVCDDALRSFDMCRPSTASNCPTVNWPAPRSRARKGNTTSGAMRAAANFAWCNRQLLMWQAREVFETIFGRSWQALRHAVGLRRGPQYRQARGARNRRAAQASVGSPQRRDARLSARAS